MQDDLRTDVFLHAVKDVEDERDERAAAIAARFGGVLSSEPGGSSGDFTVTVGFLLPNGFINEMVHENMVEQIDYSDDDYICFVGADGSEFNYRTDHVVYFYVEKT